MDEPEHQLADLVTRCFSVGGTIEHLLEALFVVHDSALEGNCCCSPCVESQHRLAAAWQEDDDDAASRSAPSSADQRSRSHP